MILRKKRSNWISGLVLLLAFFGLLSPTKTLAADFGFNIHSLAKELPENIATILDFVNQECNTTFVRLWGYDGTMGINGYTDLQKVIDNTPAGVKLIVALEDFPNGPIPSDNPAQTSAWYLSASQPTSSYYQHVQRMMSKYASAPEVAIWELANEPHCLGDAACEISFMVWAKTISDLIASYNPAGLISAGLMGGHLSWPTYLAQAQLPNMTATSCHYNTTTNDTNTCLTALANSAGKYFYVGEAGYDINCTEPGCTTLCTDSQLSVRATEALADFDSLTSAGAQAFLIWQFSPEYNSVLICDEYSVFPGDPLCDGELSLIPYEELSIPADQKTIYGQAVYGRNIPCRPLISSQDPWGEDNDWPPYEPEDYFNPYCADCSPLAPEFNDPYCTEANGCISGYPFDYSPWRPFPGDSGRYFRNFLLPVEDDTPVYYLNKCYDLTEMKSDIVTYCNPDPVIEDIFQWFPKIGDPAGTAQHYLLTYGQFRAWWTGKESGSQATQIPFLGNSLTSSTYVTQNTARMSNFLADFLRGTVFWDQEQIHCPDLNAREEMKVKNETGPIRKLYPREIMLDNEYRDQFTMCRLFGATNNCGKLISTDPIHDYALGWHIPLVGEESFTDLPDRRDNTLAENTRPIRLSEFFCGNPDWDWGAWSVGYPGYSGVDLSDYCAEGISVFGAEFPLHPSAGQFLFDANACSMWTHYYPLTSREDIPVFADVSFVGEWIPQRWGMPFGLQLDGPAEIEDIYEAVEGFYDPEWVNCDYTQCTDPTSCTAADACDPATGVVEYGGAYYFQIGWTDSDNVFGEPLPIYEFHLVDIVFVPYVVESKELAEWSRRPLVPQKARNQSAGSFGALALPNSTSCVAEEARGGLADVIAGDWRHTFDVKEPFYNNELEHERKLYLFNAYTGTTGIPESEWGCQYPEFWEFPPREENRDQNTGKITTYFPYMEDLAQNTIGPAGTLTAMMPSGFVEEVTDTINDLTNGKVYWWELPGYGPAAYEYVNDLTKEALEPHWGYCGQGPQPATSCGTPRTIPSNCFFGATDRSCHGQDYKGPLFCDGVLVGFETIASCGGQCDDGTACRCTPDGCKCDNGSNSCSAATYDLSIFDPAWPTSTKVPCTCMLESLVLSGLLACDLCDDPCGPTLTDNEWLGEVDFRGWGQLANSDEADFYFPYVGSVDIFREYLTAQVLPYRKAHYSLTGSNPVNDSNYLGDLPDGEIIPISWEVPFRTPGDPFDPNWLNIALDWLDAQGWDQNLLATEYNTVISFAQSHGWSPVFLITLWMEETGAGHFVETGVSNEHFGCMPWEEQTLEEGLECIHRNFDEYDNKMWEEFLCRYSEGFAECCPCTYELNPQFPGRIRDFYNRIALNDV